MSVLLFVVSALLARPVDAFRVTQHARPSVRMAVEAESRRSVFARAGAAATAAWLVRPASSRAADSGGLLEAGSGFQELLRPLYKAESKVQAGSYDQQAVRSAIQREIKENPVVVYSYTLSPFCTDAKAILDSAGARFKTIELGAEWIPGSYQVTKMRHSPPSTRLPRPVRLPPVAKQ